LHEQTDQYKRAIDQLEVEHSWDKVGKLLSCSSPEIRSLLVTVTRQKGDLCYGFYRSLVATMTVTQVNAHKSDGLYNSFTGRRNPIIIHDCDLL
jgi:hypothetical protein